MPIGPVSRVPGNISSETQPGVGRRELDGSARNRRLASLGERTPPTDAGQSRRFVERGGNPFAGNEFPQLGREKASQRQNRANQKRA